MQEIEIVKHFIERFENEFYIETEQWDDSGKNRIDLIITHKQDGFKFGIECKNGKIKRGTEVGNIVKQASRYSTANWRGKRIPIFLVPMLSKNVFVCPVEKIEIAHNIFIYKDRHHDDNINHHTFNGFLGAFNVGEVKRTNHYVGNYAFTFSNEIIYESYYTGHTNFDIKKYDYLIKKINNYDHIR